MPKAKAKKLITQTDKSNAETQIRDLQREVKYDIRDFTVELMVQKFREGEFYIPPYQRQYIWDETRKNKFIESLILGIPIPFMFVAEMEDGNLEIVDGAQRIQTLEQFLANDLTLVKLEKLPTLNGFRFQDLPSSQQRKVKNRALRLVLLEEETSEKLRQEIFARINTSPKRARPAEIRRGALPGPFMSFVTNCAKNSAFRELCPMSDSLRKNRQDEELILRFFAYSDRYKNFKHDVSQFLDDYVVHQESGFDEKKLSDEFLQMLNFVRNHFPSGFAKTKKSKSTPAVRFEAISVGVNLALRKDPDIVPASMEWLESPEFAFHTTTHASNSGPRLRGRVEFVRNQILSEENNESNS